MRIAIMQPYFIPYAGYFRLFCATDLFVIYDCVQFLRRGWMHRNRLYNTNRQLEWLTLPLKKAPQEILLRDIAFQDNVQHIWQNRLRAFPRLFNPNDRLELLLSNITNIKSSPIDYIISLLQNICETLKFPFQTIRSSSLNLPLDLRGEDRIIEIAKRVNAKTYVNLSGGRSLYNPHNFDAKGLELAFLSEYQGPYESILQSLIDSPLEELHLEIIKQSILT